MNVGKAIGLPLGKATRDALGEALVELGKENQDIVVLDGDLNNSTKTEYFAKAFPNRFFNVGIAESNLVGVAGGLASCGKIPFVASFACFVMCNAFDQLRLSVAYPHLNVKVVGSHGGISLGEDGPSQMSVEDVALACALPGFVVLVPADEVATKCLVKAAALHRGPVYIRVGRPRVPIVYEDGQAFTIGQANTLREGKDVAIIANGLMVAAALEAAQALSGLGIEATVLDMHTVKPIDERAIVSAAEATGALVTAEEHLVWGGLGSAVARVVTNRCPVPMEFVAISDTYAESGKPDELLKAYGLTAEDIVKAAQRAMIRKK